MEPTTSKLFKAALGRFGSGVTVVSVSANGTDHGMTASAFTSVSLDPPLILVCIKSENRTAELIQAAGHFGISILSAHQQDVSNRFAGGLIDDAGQWQPWPPERDKFADLDWQRGPSSNAPLLNDALCCLDCDLEHVYAGGDHGIFVGRIKQIKLNEETQPLLYQGGRYRKIAD